MQKDVETAQAADTGAAGAGANRKIHPTKKGTTEEEKKSPTQAGCSGFKAAAADMGGAGAIGAGVQARLQTEAV